MKKEETIVRYGGEAYGKVLEQSRQWDLDNPERRQENLRNWALRNPEKMKAKEHERNRREGKHYLKRLKYDHTGLQGERHKIRAKHAHKWQQYKKLIAPGSQIHHSWRPGTANYDGVALVEKDAHQHGIIDVIQILDGAIALFTEKEIREQECEHGSE